MVVVVFISTVQHQLVSTAIGLYRDVWIAAIASSRTSLFVFSSDVTSRHAYVTMPITFLTRKSALVYTTVICQRVASLTLDCNGVFAIKAYKYIHYIHNGKLITFHENIKKSKHNINVGCTIYLVHYHFTYCTIWHSHGHLAVSVRDHNCAFLNH